LTLLELGKEVIGDDLIVDDGLTEEVIIGLDLSTKSHHDFSDFIEVLEVVDDVLTATLGLPVLRAFALAVMGVGAVVFVNLGSDEELRHAFSLLC